MTTPSRLAVLAAAAIALPAAGCGSSDSSSSGGAGDPASAIPASASLYLEATVRPKGAQRADLEAAGRKILRTSDPGAKLIELIDKAGKDQGQTYAKDIEPWLGDKAGVAITGVSRGEPQFAVVVQSTDDDKARALVDGDKEFPAKRSFDGTDYRVDTADGTAEGVVDHFLVVASEPAFRQIVKLRSGDGDSLASNQDLADARGKVGEGPAFMFVDFQSLVRSFVAGGGTRGGPATGSTQIGPSELAVLSGAFKRFRGAGVGLEADGDAVRMHVVPLGETTGSAGAGSAFPLGSAPGDAWLAFTQKKIGESIGHAVDSFGNASTGIGGATVSDAITQIETATGLKLKQDLLSWMGDAAIFVKGDSLPSIAGALVVQSTNPAKSRAAIAKLRTLLTRFNQHVGPAPAGTTDGFTLPVSDSVPPLQIGLAGSRFVVALGKGALHDALKPASTLGDRPAFKSVSGLLEGGTTPSFYLDFRTVVRFITAVAAGDKGFQQAKPYLDAFSGVIGGTNGDGAEIAIGLK